VPENLFLNVGARARFAQPHTLVEAARVVEDVVRPLGEDRFAAALDACRADHGEAAGARELDRASMSALMSDVGG
jgi:hypothetical protein